jgi:cytidine deaminase
MTEPADLEPLFAAALAARQNAYAPYSRYRVGAAVRDETGRIHAGCNVENAAYPVGTCAEAGALAALVAGGGKRLAAILVVAEGAELVAPCGACRQRIREFAKDENTPVHLADPSGVRQTVTIGDLLPLAFGPAMLAGTAADGP